MQSRSSLCRIHGTRVDGSRLSWTLVVGAGNDRAEVDVEAVVEPERANLVGYYKTAAEAVS